MVVFLDKKRICMTLLGVFCFSAILCTSVNNTRDSIMVSATPVSSKVVVLDAGHGKPDGGAESKNGVTEEKTKFRYSIKITKILRREW